MTDKAEPTMSRDQLWAAMRRDSEGMRGLQQFLTEIKTLDDGAFPEAAGGTNRTEAMELLDRLNSLLGELNRLTGQLHPDVN